MNNDAMPIIVIGVVVTFVFLALVLRGKSSETSPSTPSDSARSPASAPIYPGGVSISPVMPVFDPRPVYRIEPLMPRLKVPFVILPPRPIYVPPIVPQPIFHDPRPFVVSAQPPATRYIAPELIAGADDFIAQLPGLKVRVQVRPHAPLVAGIRPVVSGRYVHVPPFTENSKVRIFDGMASQTATHDAVAERVFSVSIPQAVFRTATVILTVTEGD